MSANRDNSDAAASWYDGAAAGWARGAVLVYAPIAKALVERSPISLRAARVLDVGAGTGVCEAPLEAAGAALTIGADLSVDMLAWNRNDRPPAVVCDVMRLPFPESVFDATIASFVLNHLTDPVRALVEIARSLRPGGAVLATVYANDSRSANRDTVDEVARAHGWTAPEWYRELKSTATPLLGAVDSMRSAATGAGLTDVVVSEEPVDVGVTEPAALVDYRFGQAQFSDWLARLDRAGRETARAEAIASIAAAMEPYRPRVVFLAARVAP